MVELVDVNRNTALSSWEEIQWWLLGSSSIQVMWQILAIQISSEDYINESKHLTQEQIENIMFSEVLSPLQQEFKYWHDNLSHLHPKSVFRLAKLGVLPSIFLYLKDDVPLCVPLMFGTARKRQQRTKWKKSGSIRKKTNNNPGAEVLVDQLQSYQPGLVPKLSGRLTSVHIWTAQVMVDQFGYLTHMNLTTITIQ